jgi:hypothetical protein
MSGGEHGATEAPDPREMTPEYLAKLGFKRISRGDAIKAKCLDCMGGNHAEVRRCQSGNCALWPLRFGDPWREAREMTEDQRQAGAARLRRARESRSAPQPSAPEPIRRISLFDDD